jgi:hypothetical protein
MASTVAPESMVPRLIEKAFVLNFHGEEIRIQQVDRKASQYRKITSEKIN